MDSKALVYNYWRQCWQKSTLCGLGAKRWHHFSLVSLTHAYTAHWDNELGFKKKKGSLDIQFICVLDSGMSNRALQRIPLHLCHSHNSITLVNLYEVLLLTWKCKVFFFFCKPYTVLFNIPCKKHNLFVVLSVSIELLCLLKCCNK